MSIRLTSILLVACALLAGCGGTSGSDRPNQEASLLLDFTPNGVHAGIYLATSRGYDDAEGVQLDVQAPSASTDALRLLQGGRADMAILDIHDLGLARQEGARRRRRHGARADAAGRRARAAGDRAPARSRGPPRRRHRPAVRRRRAALGGGGRRRRPGAGAHDDDRLRGGQGAARGPRRRRHGVLERRGRRAARGAPRHAGVPRRRVRRSRLPGARAVRDPRDAARRSGRSSRRRSGRSSAATPRPRPTRRAR